MNRRNFLKASTTGAAVAVAAPSILLTTGCSTAWISTVINDIPELINIADSVISIVGVATGNGTLATAAGATVTTFANVLKASLTAMQDAANAYNSNKSQGNLQALIAATQAVQNDLANITAALPSGTVSSSLQTSLVAGIGLAVTIMSAIQAIIPGAAPVAVTASAVQAVSQGKVSVPNADTIRYAYNCTLRIKGYPGQVIK